MGLSEFLRKTFVSQTSRAKEAGQAVIEYLLVLIITLAIILGMMYQFNDAFKQFLDTYFGDYIACLLETGELPALGGSGPNQGQCVSPFGDFNVAAGASQYEGGSDPGASGSSSSSSSSDDSSDSSDSGGSGGSGNRSLRRSTVSRSGAPSNAEFAAGANSRKGSPAVQRINSGSDSTRQNGFTADSSEGSVGGRRGRTRRRTRVIYLGDAYLSSKEKNKKGRAILGKAKPAKKSKGSGSLRKPSYTLDADNLKPKPPPDKPPSFSMGALIKILLIAGIIIAIVLFLGGQGLQIKKSWEKSE